MKGKKALTVLFVAQIFWSRCCNGLDHFESFSESYKQTNDEPPQISKTYEVQNDQYLGCYMDNGLCNDNEICFDDSLLGQCLPKDNPQQYLRDIPTLSDEDIELLSLELEQLTEGGFAWTDIFTQCILQNLLDTFQFGTTFDEESCAIFLNDDNEDNTYEQHEEQTDNDDELTTRELIPKDSILINDEDSNGLTNVVPKKMIIQGTSLAEPDTNYLQVGHNSNDQGILIEPNSQEIVEDFLINTQIEDDADKEELKQQQQREEDDEFIDPSQFQNFGIPQIDEEGLREKVFPYKNEEEIDMSTFLAVQDALKNQLQDQPEPSSQEEAIWSNEGNNSDLEDKMSGNTLTNDVRKIKKREQFHKEGQEPYYEYLPSYLYPTQEEFSKDYPSIEEQQHYEDEILFDPNSNVISRLGLNGGLGSRIFNRNERLDVKKPGPSYKNSANNFFFDKFPNGKLEEMEPNDTKSKGQVEYEMPLLAPVKDKRELILEQNGTPENSLKDFVHIALKNRFNTYKQGEAFINLLANEFNVPAHALRDKLIENQHVQFRVDSNPQSIDAIQMAKRIDQDKDLHAKIGDQIGVEVDRAAPGYRDDVKYSLFTIGSTNFNLLLLMVFAVSIAAAMLVVVSVLLLIRRRKRIMRKQGLLQNDQDDEGAQDEYKQLCRDWSRSSKKVDQGTKAVHKKVQNQDSKESQRSSTSSWPEEPTTSNMDISTGHMVLAYMEDHLKNKQRLEQEWVSLCGYEAEPSATTVAFRAENKKKNRYPDKLPYDHNRVILNVMANASNSDYMNASTITDHDPRNPSYIVTQAPLSSTVADFWQMIWEQGCVVIVMLTRLQDNGHQLCHRYWPEEGSEQYHIFEVHLVSEHVWCDDYLVRSVYLKNTRTGETRTVTQFHFRSWPAHGVPSSTKALLEFRRKVNKSYRGRSCPICIHCSDGVGRSGTYTLLDMVLNRMSKGCKEIDIAAALEHIRDQRGGMVQSRQQFEFCLMAVAEEVHAILKALPQ